MYQNYTLKFLTPPPPFSFIFYEYSNFIYLRYILTEVLIDAIKNIILCSQILSKKYQNTWMYCKLQI